MLGNHYKRQRTIAREVSCSGIGLHTGRRVTLRLRPASEDTGIVFLRKDLGGGAIPAVCRNLASSRFSTSLAESGLEIRTVEHLLSAVYGMAVDNLLIEVNGPEVPILDGSAGPFVRLLEKAGFVGQQRFRRYLKVRRPVVVSDGPRRIQVLPGRGLRVTYTIDFHHPLIPRQVFQLCLTPERFLREVASARTFCRLEEVEQLRQMGLARGGSLRNAVVVSRGGLLNGHLRFRDEFVRHKVLDLVGDLCLAGYPLQGHVVAHRAGHGLHTRLVSALLATREAWELSPGFPALVPADFPSPVEKPVMVGGAVS